MFPRLWGGAILSIVEKTDDTELLSETIQNGKFNVSYNTADANYIVLKATMPQAENGLANITAKSYTREYGDAVFTIDGRRVDKLKKGLYIIRMKDGTIRKEVVRDTGIE